MVGFYAPAAFSRHTTTSTGSDAVAIARVLNFVGDDGHQVGARARGA